MEKINKTNHVAIMAVVILVIAVVSGGVGYKIGDKMSQAKRMTQFASMRQQGGQGSGQGLRDGSGQGKTGGGQMQGQGRRHTEGEILSVDDKGVTVKLADGTSKVVLFSDKTTYALSSTADKSKVVVGQKVDIVGDPNTDGSVSASEIRIVQ